MSEEKKLLAEDLMIKAGSEPIKKLEDKFQLIPAYLKVRGLVKQHIDSYNHFINVDIKKIVKANNVIRSDQNPAWYLKFRSIHLGTPSVVDESLESSVTPQDCRLRDLTYSAPIYVSVDYVVGRETVHKSRVRIGKMPIMLRSSNCVLNGKGEEELIAAGECPLDPGGYFIVRGVERAILSQEQKSNNRVIIEHTIKGELCASVISYTYENISRFILYLKNGKFYAKHPAFTEDVPLMILVKAMGLESDQEFAQLVGADEDATAGLAGSMEDCIARGVLTQAKAHAYLAARMRLRQRYGGAPTGAAAAAQQMSSGGSAAGTKSAAGEVLDVLANQVISHIPATHYNFRQKELLLALMVRWILVAERTGTLDDTDYYGNKRLQLAGQLLSLLFEDLFKTFVSRLKREADKELAKVNHAGIFDVGNLLTTEFITQGLNNALSTGNWRIPRFKMDRAGVTQVLSRNSYIATLGHMTRISSTLEKTRKVSGPRSLQGSQWGMLCPSDTPEGESCGLVKALALLTHVTSDDSTSPIHALAYNLGVEDASLLGGDDLYREGSWIVFHNGQILGVHSNPAWFLRMFRLLRRRGRIGEFVSVYMNLAQRTIHIATDGGRVCRPLIIVEQGRPLVTQEHIAELKAGVRTFDDFVRDGLIEFLDVNEENNSYIAIDESYIRQETTHMEIDPLSLLGVVAGLIPYPHHNQSPRNTYQCAMGKQAMGFLAFNQQTRIDTIQYLLAYSQVPLVKTKTIDMIQYPRIPAGHAAMVAVMSYSGYDIEDAVILNKGSLDRGFARCIVMRKYTTDIAKNDRVLRPPQSSPSQQNGMPIPGDQFALLDSDGIICPGETVAPNTVLVNKLTPVVADDIPGAVGAVTSYKPAKLTYKQPYGSVVDKVVLAKNDDGNTVVKIALRSTRVPELGDKFSSRHGQKGVTGLIAQQEDMPFTEQGINPDIIMNPHGFPSRMTVGKMIELIAGKAAVLDGRFAYGTAFGGDRMCDISESLIRHGFSYTGKDLITSGITGEPLTAYIFFGPVYYQKLKHMVLDKMHARFRGPRATLTRQPTEGRSKEGGLRLGEMERDCLIGYGASSLILERLMISSDIYTAFVCKKCGLICYKGWCQNCRSSQAICKVTMPYACKLLFNELQSMNILPRLHVDDI